MYSLISKALHHFSHTLNHNGDSTFAGFDGFCTILHFFYNNNIESSVTRVNISQFNVAILSHLRKLISFNIINIKCGQLSMTMFAVILPKKHSY